MSHADVVPSSGITPAPHIRQELSWDCGVACAAMVLRHLGLTTPRLSDIGTSSPWTLDVFYLLQGHGCHSITFCTTVLGVDESHASMPFYQVGSGWDATDVHRLNFLFHDAMHVRKWKVVERSFTRSEFIAMLDDPSVLLIVLVDASRLYCSCRAGILSACLWCCGSRAPYIGHYVVALGRDVSGSYVMYNDPARPSAPCACPLDSFHNARTARGTDEDIIICRV